MLIAILAALFASVFNACADSDDFIYEDVAHTEITIEATMARSFDTNSVKKTADTITAGDSMIFIASVYPSKSVRVKDYYWEMDNLFFASEFSVRDAILSSGHHEFVFILIDFFGDTLRDTVNLWVAEKPILKTTNFIPASGSQGLPPNKDIQFAWKVYNPDTLQKLFYHFTLTHIGSDQSQDSEIIDTTISTPYFTCNKNLKPLSVYRWSVNAFNEYSIQSKDKITSEFSTMGVNDEAGIFGTLSPSNPTLFADIDVIVLDTNKIPTGIATTIERTPVKSSFTLNPLAPGKYMVTAKYKKGPDFTADTLPVTLTAGEVVKLDTLHLIDAIPPTIQSMNGSDTIDFADSLSFIIEDGSGSSVIQNTVIYFGDRKITSFQENGNKITFATTDEDRTWITQLVSISAKDASGNKKRKDFYVRSAESWFTMNNDTTISSQKSIKVFLKDINPYGFKPQKYIIKPQGDNFGALICTYENCPDGLENIYNTGKFNIGPNKIIDSVIYESTITQTRSWTLTLNAPPEMDASYCSDPCDSVSYAGTTADFEWRPASDPENDAMVYRIVYTLSKDETDENKFIYPMSYTAKNSATLKRLPVGDIYWWVEAKDSYGGKSEIWENRIHLIIYDDTGTTDTTKGDNDK